MKKIIAVVVGIFAIALVSCNNDDIDTIEEDLTITKERLDLVKRQQIILKDSIAVLTESFRNEQSLLKELLNEENPSELNHLERGEALAEVFERTARQPASFEDQEKAATVFIGAFDVSVLTGNALIDGTSRGTALNGLFKAVARQPEAFDNLVQIATKFLGNHDPDVFSAEVTAIAIAIAGNGLNEALARQPEGEELYNQITAKFLGFSFLEIVAEVQPVEVLEP